MGRQVKQEAQLNNKQRHTQRTNRLEEKRELVEATKQEEFSVPEESKNFSFHQKEEKGGARAEKMRWAGQRPRESQAGAPAGRCTRAIRRGCARRRGTAEPLRRKEV